MNKDIENLLISAYAPCNNLINICDTMIWNPEKGHVPRGFTGATGSSSDVLLVLVGAEPGNPHDSEKYITDGNPNLLINSKYNYTWECLENGKDLFHRNIRLILNKCFPSMSFKEQMKYTWITDSVLCSAQREGGSIQNRCASSCCKKYLLKEIELFQNAIVVALGGKADNRLKKVGYTKHFHAFSAAPPGCNYKRAKESWEKISNIIRKEF